MLVVKQLYESRECDNVKVERIHRPDVDICLHVTLVSSVDLRNT